jgi:hypothetical protein
MARGATRHDAVQLLVDLTVYAPIGLLSLARERLPQLAATGRGRLHERAQDRLALARFMGEMAVRQGRREIDRRLRDESTGRKPAPVTGRTPASPVVAGPLDEIVDVDDVDDVEDVEDVDLGGECTAHDVDAGVGTPSASGSSDAHESLPIDGYESLAASQVVARLGSLGPDELDSVEAFERAHRNRRTVVGRIAQLRVGR